MMNYMDIENPVLEIETPVLDTPLDGLTTEEGHYHSIVVDKTTQRIRFVNESEKEVTIIIEPLEKPKS